MEQGIFTPHMLLIDGLPFEEPAALGTLDALKALTRKHGMHVWFTVRTRRQESDSPEDLPPSFAAVADLFEIALELKPEGKNIHLKALKGAVKVAEHPTLVLDPATLLMRDSA